jgi:hypothetical protein
MSRISADDTNFLPAGKKILRHYVSSVAACSKNDVHISLHFQVGCGGSGLGFSRKVRRTGEVYDRLCEDHLV